MTVKEGTIYHYWGTRNELTWYYLLYTAAIDLVLAAFSWINFFSVPLQFTMYLAKYVVNFIVEFLYNLSEAEIYLPEAYEKVLDKEAGILIESYEKQP